MVDKLPDDASKLTPLEFKKIFLDASTFSRKVANPIASKSEKSFNTLFNALERGIINPSRVTRAKYKDELQELDSKFKDYQLNKLAEEEQERKLTNGLRELLKEQRGDKKAMTYIVNLLQEGTNLKLITTPSSSSGKNIGGSLIRGGTNGEAINSVVNYLKGVFTLTIKKETLDGIVLEDIKQFHSNYSALTTPLLPKHNGVVKNDLEDRATDVLTLLNITITTDIIDILKTDSVTISATTTTCTNAKQQETATIPKNFALNFIIYMYDTDKRVNISKYMESLIS